MLVKINKIDEAENKVSVTLLDIDELGSVIPMKELRLNLPSYDNSVINILRASTHAIIFTEDFDNAIGSSIISAINLTDDELNQEKGKIIQAANDKINKNE